jgi:acetyl esterase
MFAEGIQDYVDRVRRIAAEVNTGNMLDDRRLRYDLLADEFRRPYPPGMRVRNTFVVMAGHEIPVRVYWPPHAKRPPIICYFHGGGFLSGSIESHDMITSALCEFSGAAVISVHYRRVPECPYPMPQEDCYAALCWAAERADALGLDGSRIAVAGDSAGGLLSTAVAMMARDRNGPRLRHQALIYGVFDFNLERASYKTAKDPLLTYQAIQYLAPAYLGGRLDTQDPYAVPMRAKNLSGLPPAYILRAEFDTLFEEEGEYADKLRAAGVATELRDAPGMIHGFLRPIETSPPAMQELKRMAEIIRSHLRPDGVMLLRRKAK